MQEGEEDRRKRWDNNFNEWAGMEFGDSLRAAKEGKGEKVLLQCHLWFPDDRHG